MSTLRISPEAGWRAVKLDQDGNKLCRFCQGVITAKRRLTFCSDECVHQHKLTTDPGYVRALVEKRDRGICALCGIDTIKLSRRHRALKQKLRARFRWDTVDTSLGRRWDDSVRWVEARLARWSRLTGFWSDRRGHAWEADHIVPVVEGGGECGLDNYRTLCLQCHKAETRKLAARRSGKVLVIEPSLFGGAS